MRDRLNVLFFDQRVEFDKDNLKTAVAKGAVLALAVTQAIAVPQAATTMAGSVRLSWLSRELSPAPGSPPALAECGGAVALGSTGSASGSGSVRPMRPRKEMATHV